MSRTSSIIVLILTAAALGLGIVAVHNYFHPSVPWQSFAAQEDALGLSNTMTMCKYDGDKWGCLTFEADYKTVCTTDTCAPLMEIE